MNVPTGEPYNILCLHPGAHDIARAGDNRQATLASRDPGGRCAGVHNRLHAAATRARLLVNPSQMVLRIGCIVLPTRWRRSFADLKTPVANSHAGGQPVRYTPRRIVVEVDPISDRRSRRTFGRQYQLTSFGRSHPCGSLPRLDSRRCRVLPHLSDRRRAATRCAHRPSRPPVTTADNHAHRFPFGFPAHVVTHVDRESTATLALIAQTQSVVPGWRVGPYGGRAEAQGKQAQHDGHARSDRSHALPHAQCLDLVRSESSVSTTRLVTFNAAVPSLAASPQSIA